MLSSLDSRDGSKGKGRGGTDIGGRFSIFRQALGCLVFKHRHVVCSDVSSILVVRFLDCFVRDIIFISYKLFSRTRI